jgi:ribosomal protein L35AE/L33A
MMVNRGRHLSYQRGKRNTNPGTSLIQIEGVENTEAAKYVRYPSCKDGESADSHFSFYLGKKVAFVYRAQREVRGSKIRVIWGKITRPHGISPESNDKKLRLTVAFRQLRCSTSTV